MDMTTTYAPPPGPPPKTYNPPSGLPPTVTYPPPLREAEFPLLSAENIHTLSTQGFTTFPIKERLSLYEAATSLFGLSRRFFAQNQSEKEQFIIREANAQGSEEGWSRVVGEKELLTLRRSGSACPDMLGPSARLLWDQCGQLMKEVVRGIERSLDITPHSLDPIFIPECVMPQAGEDRVETLLRMFRYERKSEETDNTDSNSGRNIGKGRLVAEPHRDLGIISLVIGSSPGLEVWDSFVGNWIPIEQPPYSPTSGLTATLLIGETLTYLTNGRFVPGRHRVFVPPLSSAEIDDGHQQYRYSLVFTLRPHSSAIISTSTLTSPITGAFKYPLEGITAGDLFQQIARSHWNINTGKKEREAQRIRLQRGTTLTPDADQSTSTSESDQSHAQL